jgi:hypothetical protein
MMQQLLFLADDVREGCLLQMHLLSLLPALFANSDGDTAASWEAHWLHASP